MANEAFSGICTYCDWLASFKSREALQQGLREHLQQCQQHPMAGMRARAEKAEAEVERLKAERAAMGEVS